MIRTGVKLAAVGLESSTVVHGDGVALLRLALALHLVGDINLKLVGGDEAGKSGSEEKSGLHGVCCGFPWGCRVCWVGCGEERNASPSLGLARLGVSFREGRGEVATSEQTRPSQIGDGWNTLKVWAGASTSLSATTRAAYSDCSIAQEIARSPPMANEELFAELCPPPKIYIPHRPALLPAMLAAFGDNATEAERRDCGREQDDRCRYSLEVQTHSFF